MSNIVPVKQAPLAGLAGYGGGVPGLYFLGADGTSVSITKSLRFNNAHKSYLKRTPSSAGNRRTFTFSCWVKRTTIGSSLMRRFFAAGATSVSTNNVTLAFYQDTLFFQIGTSSNRITSSQVFRDTAAWYHIVLAVDTTQATASNRVKIYVNGSQITDFGTAGYPSQNTDTAVNNTEQHIVGAGVDSGGTVPDGPFDGYMADCHLVDGSQLDPTSFGAFNSDGVWNAAKFNGSYGTNGYHLFDFESESTVGHDSSGNNNDFTAYNILAATGQYLDDITGTQRSGFPWSQMFDGRLNHGAVPNPGSSFTFSPSPSIPFTTLQIYAYKDSSPGTLKINGTDITSQVPNHNGIGPNQLTTITGISSPLTSIQSISNGSLANIVFAGLVIDGALLLDTAAEVDVLFDVPANGDSSDDTGAGAQVSGNYATLNVLEDAAAGGNAALSNGNLQIDGTSSEQFRAATIPVSSGKWYFEIVQREGTDFGPGVWAYPLASPSSQFYQNTNYRYNSNGGVYNQSGQVASYGGFAVGDVIGTALDLDNGKVYFSNNGTWQNSGNPATQTNPAATGLTGQWVFGASTNGNGTILNANFGQHAFAYNAPSGFKALCTTNLPDPTIADGSDYFDVKTWTGNGGTQSISNLEFSPDLAWIKARNHQDPHALFDTVRGVQKRLSSNSNGAEVTSSDGITSFNADGWTMGANGSNNANNLPYVGWIWDAGSSTSTNSDGSIYSSVRVNQTAGFSIVSYSGNATAGATVGHGLNAVPAVYINKRRDSADGWYVYHKDVTTGKVLILDTSDAENTSSFTNSTEPTSSVFTLGSAAAFNANNSPFITYCFAPVAGYSAFGSYTGNGSADGPFIYTGFRPSLVVIKRSDAANDWNVQDFKRTAYNGQQTTSLQWNSTNTEAQVGTDYRRDILSNGFKIRNNGSETNASGGTYVYIAFAENPFQANGGLAR